jgi:2-polyprenyl-6-methoxyphenol hydroxylase-like FAD-dependent oxidoreductase
VYNRPAAELQDQGDIAASASGWVRIGMMRLQPGVVGLFGNIPRADEHPTPHSVRTGKALADLFTPEEGEDALDEFGRYVQKIFREHGDTAHWTRKQETDTLYKAPDGKHPRVLFIGDAAGAIYPSLGQGANLSLEDACVAGALFPDMDKIAELRHDRREFIKR